MIRSSNCHSYTDAISLFVGGTATPKQAKGDAACTVTLNPIFSCQTSAYEKPDAETLAMLTNQAVTKLEKKGCDVDAASVQLQLHTNQIRTPAPEYSAKDLVESGMCSNCYMGDNDINDAPHIGRATCRNEYHMTDSMGREVKNTQMTFQSNLRVCDTSDKAMPQVYEDLRKVAAYNGSLNGYTAHRDQDLACTFSILPAAN